MRKLWVLGSGALAGGRPTAVQRATDRAAASQQRYAGRATHARAAGSRRWRGSRCATVGGGRAVGPHADGPCGCREDAPGRRGRVGSDRARPAALVSVPFLFARLGLAFSDDARQEALNALAATDALVLDDIDKTRPTEYAAEQLFCAIDTRVTAGAGLLVTTNLAPSALAERFPDPYGEAIVSRLVGHCETFALEGGDRRLERRVA